MSSNKNADIHTMSRARARTTRVAQIMAFTYDNGILYAPSKCPMVCGRGVYVAQVELYGKMLSFTSSFYCSDNQNTANDGRPGAQSREVAGYAVA